METPQSKVDEVVYSGMHAAVSDDDDGHENTSHADKPDVHNACCQALYGFCKRHALHGVAQHFARQFSKVTRDKKWPAGTLVRIRAFAENAEYAASSSSTSAPPGTDFFFLGVLCKKPLMQVFIKAWPQGQNKFAVTPEDGALPVMLTSFLAFQDLARNSGCDVDRVALRAQMIPHYFQRHMWSAEQLEVIAIAIRRETEILLEPISARHQAAAEDVELPFGLKPEKRKRKRRTPAKSGGRAAPKAGRGRHRGSHGHSDSCSSSDTGSEPDCCSDGDDVAHIEMPTEAATEEAVRLDEAVSEFHEMVPKRAEIAEAYRSGGSYFVKQVGFDEGSIAPTSRSMCYHCNKSINKGCARFSYFWSQRRPSRFMHEDCVVPFVLADEGSRKVQAIATMHRLAVGTGVPAIKSAAQRLLAVLTGRAAASST